MRKTIKEEVELVVCDVCGYRQDRHNHLISPCRVCGRDFCLSCAGIGLNPFDIGICKECVVDPKVEELMKAALPRYRAERDKLVSHLKALNITRKTRDREREWEDAEKKKEAEHEQP